MCCGAHAWCSGGCVVQYMYQYMFKVLATYIHIQFQQKEMWKFMRTTCRQDVTVPTGGTSTRLKEAISNVDKALCVCGCSTEAQESFQIVCSFLYAAINVNDDLVNTHHITTDAFPVDLRLNCSCCYEPFIFDEEEYINTCDCECNRETETGCKVFDYVNDEENVDVDVIDKDFGSRNLCLKCYERGHEWLGEEDKKEEDNKRGRDEDEEGDRESDSRKKIKSSHD